MNLDEKPRASSAAPDFGEGGRVSGRRVLHVVNGDLYSGAERVQDLLALGLAGFGYRVGFVCLKKGLFASNRHARKAPLHEVLMHSRFDIGCAKRIASIVRREGYALVHTHTARSALVGRLAASMAGVPMVHHVHSPTARDTENVLRNRMNAWLERCSMAGVACLMPVSSSLEHDLAKRGYVGERVRMVANGVPVVQLPARAAPVPPWTIGTMALYRPRKGLEVLLDALALLRDRGTSMRLLAVGPFDTETYRAAIMTQCDALALNPLVEWTGFTDDVTAQFQRMDAFVLPSLYGEGMPMVVLEAMAHGTPVVASAVEGVPEVIVHGRTGLLVPPGDAQALATALQELTGGRHDWAAMRGGAPQTQRERFSDQSMARGVAEVYDRVLGNRNEPNLAMTETRYRW
jgi:glycosyltransferase involved in cell wall biosynthesis